MTLPPAQALVVVLIMAAVALVVPAPARVGRPAPARPALPRAPLLLLAAVWLAVAGTWASPRRFVLAILLFAVFLGGVRLVRRQRAARVAGARSEEVLAVCEAIASDLAAGQPPLLALERARAEWSELAPVAVAGRMGADVPATLRELSRRPGGAQLRVLAASWQVAEESGAGLAASIGQAAEAIRVDRHTTRLVAAELASARATARMLAALPAGALLMGSGLGADPVGFLTDSTAGLICLALGIALSFAGLWWLEGIAARVLP